MSTPSSLVSFRPRPVWTVTYPEGEGYTVDPHRVAAFQTLRWNVVSVPDNDPILQNWMNLDGGVKAGSYKPSMTEGLRYAVESLPDRERLLAKEAWIDSKAVWCFYGFMIMSGPETRKQFLDDE
ncbi:hypothetical protein BDV96DRAFT_641949 [Lophiotrema nucula]|uniref:Uncharacterized protein n=1 Tax=Lophiotrema nucula TaxID=690887 RepID=A0A6A5ZKH3_9PLEO|nr:hypothetical protein BDV96DRAFT_641949 [Lophiotrema nucula]